MTDKLRALIASWRHTAAAFAIEAMGEGWGDETAARCGASARRLRECADELEAAIAAGGNDGPEPGEPIGTCACPCCGASLEVEHGDEPGQIAVIGSGACECASVGVACPVHGDPQEESNGY